MLNWLWRFLKIEAERKFLVEVEGFVDADETRDIFQVYLAQSNCCPSEVERRVRQQIIRRKGFPAESIKLTYTEKSPRRGFVWKILGLFSKSLLRQEKEIEIKDELHFEELVKGIDPETSPIRKRRHILFVQIKRKFLPNREIKLEVDEFWEPQIFWLLEVENLGQIKSKDLQRVLPNNIKIIKEVTNDPNFKNKNIAKSHYTQK